MSKNLNQTEKHFEIVSVMLTSDNETLNDNTFGDITFDTFSGSRVARCPELLRTVRDLTCLSGIKNNSGI